MTFQDSGESVRRLSVILVGHNLKPGLEARKSKGGEEEALAVDTAHWGAAVPADCVMPWGVDLSDICSPRLTSVSWGLSQSHQWAHAQIPDPQTLWEMAHVCCFKLLSLGMVSHIASQLLQEGDAVFIPCYPYCLRESLLPSAGRTVQAPDYRGGGVPLPLCPPFLCVPVTPSLSPGCLGEWMRKDTQNDTDGPFCSCLNWVEDGKLFCVPVGFRNGYK